MVWALFGCESAKEGALAGPGGSYYLDVPRGQIHMKYTLQESALEDPILIHSNSLYL